jgi:hypothetical protein
MKGAVLQGRLRSSRALTKRVPFGELARPVSQGRGPVGLPGERRDWGWLGREGLGAAFSGLGEKRTELRAERATGAGAGMRSLTTGESARSWLTLGLLSVLANPPD